MHAAICFAGLLQAAAIHIEQPAVVHASQAAIFDAAVTQVSLAMSTMQAQHSDTAVATAKQHQVLAHDCQRIGRAARGYVGG